MTRYTTTLFALALLFSACDSGNGGGGPGGACDSGSMTATVDGQSFTAECVVIDISNNTLTITGITNFDGSDGPTQRQINIGGVNAQPGAQTPLTATYSEADASDPTGGLNCSVSSVIPGANSTINVNAIDGSSASGTFSFEAMCFMGTQPSGSITAMNGMFNISE